MTLTTRWSVRSPSVLFALLALTTPVFAGNASDSQNVKTQLLTDFLSTGGLAARQVLRGATPRVMSVPGGGTGEDPGEGLIPPDELGMDFAPPPGDGNGRPGEGSRFRNVFVNDPCLDPPPPRFDRTVQSETEIAVLNRVPRAENNPEDEDDDGSSGRLMVAGYNDSYGFYNANQGLSGFSYSTDSGKTWIDGGGLPPINRAGLPASAPGQDAYYGDPVVVVHHRTKTFYYASIYKLPNQTFALAVNRGKFKVAPPQGTESKANTRCKGNPARFGIPDPPFSRERIIWEAPVVASFPIDPGDLLDKEWLYVDQKTGELYLVYVRFSGDGSGATPLELVRSFDGGHTWTAPSIILPNLDDTFNTGLSVVTTPTGRVVVSWYARTFSLSPPFPEISDRIESVFSDNDGVTFSAPILVTGVNPQGEPPGYNRGRQQILNVTYLAVYKGNYDGAGGSSRQDDDQDRGQPGFGNVYVTYFDGKGPLGQIRRAGDIKLSVSTNNGSTWHSPVKVNDDETITSHVFPSVQVNKRGTVFVTWVDRRVDPVNNFLTDTWGVFSNNQGRSFGRNFRITDVSTDWFVRADARPNLGDYNSSEVIDFDSFASIWSDGRFPAGTFTFVPSTCTPQPPPGTPCPPVTRRAATPDVLFSNVGNGSADNGGGSGGSSDQHY